MFTSLVCELYCYTCVLAAMDRRALTNQRCDSWRVGVHSMAPVGAWLPWAEVLTLAGRCGWSEFDCQAAAETWTSLSGAELTWTEDHSSILRVRLLPLDKTDGVLDLSDDEEIPSAHLEISPLFELFPPWKTWCECVHVVACKASTLPSATLWFPTGLGFTPPSPTH